MQRTQRLLFASAACLVLASFASAASATTFTDVTVEELAAASDLIVVGRVVDVEVVGQGPAGQPGIHTRATVQVDEVLRGAGRSLVDVWVQGGRLGDRMRVVPGQARFVEGEEVTVFLFEAGGAHWPTGMGLGKWLVNPDTGAVRPGALDASNHRLVGEPDGSTSPRTLAELRGAVRSSTRGGGR